MKDQTWPAIALSLPESISRFSWEIFCAKALEEGCLGYEEDEDRPGSAPARAVFFFPAEGDCRVWGERMAELARRFLGATAVQIEPQTVRDTGWTLAWREYYHASRASPRFFVGPPEEAALPSTAPEGTIYIAVQLGSAFGTGGHASTKVCLRLLEDSIPPHRSVFDVGTGTGVLSFAAIKLGAEFALAMDSDPLCEDNFTQNAGLNGCEDDVLFVHTASIEEAVGAAYLRGRPVPDLIVCNMLSDAFDPMLLPMRQLRRPLVLAGFLDSEAARVEIRLRETGWRITRRVSEEEWGGWTCEPDASFRLPSR